MPDEDKTFSGSLVLDLRIWWRHMHNLYISKLSWVLYGETEKCSQKGDKIKK